MRSQLCSLLAMSVVLAGAVSASAAAPTADELIGRHAQEQSAVWRDGDVVTFFYRGDDEAVALFSALLSESKRLERLPNSDVWTTTVTRPDLDRGIFFYSLVPIQDGHSSPPGSWTFGYWRGPAAPPAPTVKEKLSGEVLQFDVDSESLGATRPVSVYLPAADRRRAAMPVVYLADGQSTEGFAEVIEPLVDQGRIPPLAIVGVHSIGQTLDVVDPKSYDAEKDLRAQEYVPGFNPARFAKHETFFCQEVPRWAEQQFGVSSDRAERVVAGYSNGGHLAVELGRRHPDLFGHVFGFSCGTRANRTFDVEGPPSTQPRYYLAAGTWEEGFHKSASHLADELNRQKIPVVFSSRIAGHDSQIWHEEFVAAALWAFGKK